MQSWKEKILIKQEGQLEGKQELMRKLSNKFSIKRKRLNFRHGYKNPRPHFCNRSTLIIHI